MLVSFALVLAAGCGDDGSAKDEPTEDVKDSDDKKADPSVSVPATEEALQNQVAALISDIRSGNDQRASETLADLALPKPREYFMGLYSDDVVDRLVKDYGDARQHLPELAEVIKSQLDKGRTKVVIESFDDPNDRKAVGYQTIALREMRKPTPLYSVRLVGDDEGDSFHIWSFVHDGKAFRWVGKLSRVQADIAKKRRQTLELRVEKAFQIAE